MSSPRQSPRKHRSPEYFDKFPPPQWNIEHYLHFSCPGRPVAREDYSTALDNWPKQLKDTKVMEKDGKRAEALLKGYEKTGRTSDRLLARQWYQQFGDHPPSKRPASKPAANNQPTKRVARSQTPQDHQPSLQRRPHTHIHNHTNSIVLNSEKIDSVTVVQQVPDNHIAKDSASEEVSGDTAKVKQGKGTENKKDKKDGNEDKDEDADVRASRKDITPEPAEAVFIKVDVAYQNMKPVFLLKSGNGRALEQICRQYAWGLQHVDLVHLFIVDKSMRLEFSDSEWEEVNSSLLSRPGFPVELDQYQQRYNEIKTFAECMNIEIKRGRSLEEKWIDDVIYHCFRLFSKFNSSYPRHLEGWWDSLVHSVFWDQYLMDLPNIDLDRKELTLSAFDHYPDIYVKSTSLFDGIVRFTPSFYTRFSRHLGGLPSEFAIFEVSGTFKETKWNIDRTKLLAACRASMCRLQNIVDYDADTVKKLSVFGVLQAGAHTQIYLVNPVSCNVVFVRASTCYELPSSVSEMRKVYDLISAIWRCKEMLRDSSNAVAAYLEKKYNGSSIKTANETVNRTDPDFCHVKLWYSSIEVSRGITSMGKAIMVSGVPSGFYN